MNATTIPVDEQAVSQVQKQRFGRVGLVAGLGASVATLAVAAVAQLADVSLEIESEPIPLLGFAQITFIAALIGIGLAAAFTRWARRPRRTFLVSTVSLTALSLVPPLLATADTATKVVLELTHIVAAVVIIPAIASRLPD